MHKREAITTKLFWRQYNSAVVSFVEDVLFSMVQNALFWTVKSVLCGEVYYNYYDPMLDSVYTVVTADI